MLDSESRGVALSNVEKIRTVHNSYSRQEPFIFSKEKKSEGGDLPRDRERVGRGPRFRGDS